VKSEDAEPAALLSIVVSDEGAVQDPHSDTASRRSHRSNKGARGKANKHNGLQPAAIDEVEDELGADLDDLDLLDEEEGEEPWIEFEEKTPPHPFDKSADGVDVYIDGARSLPDNCTVTRVVMKNMMKNNKLFEEERDGKDGALAMCDLGGNILAPKYTLRQEYRSEHFDPTATLMIRVDTIDKQTKKIVVVGYALLSLFTEVGNRKKQPEDSNDQEYCLNAGSFQLPLIKMSPNIKDKKFAASKLDGFKRVSCATVLVRIIPAPKNDLAVKSRADYDDPAQWVKEGLDIPAPEYSSKVYDSTRCVPLPIEAKLYGNRKQRDAMPTKEYVLQQLMKKYGEEKDVTEIQVEEMEQFISENFGGKLTGYLDYTYMNQYNTETGFKVTIDGLHRMKGGSFTRNAPFYKVLYTLSPPAMFYETNGSMTTDVEFTRQYDVNSEQNAPKFMDKAFEYKNLGTDGDNMVLVMEVRSLSLKKKAWQVSDQASSMWGVLPIFKKNNKNYVDSGCFCVPLFEGKVPSDAVGSNTPDDIYDFIEKEMKKSKKEKPLILHHGASVIVRLVDSCVEEFEDPVNDLKHVNMKYVQRACEISGKALGTYDYDPKAEPGKKNITKLAGKEGEKELAKINISMRNGCGFDENHYNFD